MLDVSRTLFGRCRLQEPVLFLLGKTTVILTWRRSGMESDALSVATEVRVIPVASAQSTAVLESHNGCGGDSHERNIDNSNNNDTTDDPSTTTATLTTFRRWRYRLFAARPESAPTLARRRHPTGARSTQSSDEAESEGKQALR